MKPLMAIVIGATIGGLCAAQDADAAREIHGVLRFSEDGGGGEFGPGTGWYLETKDRNYQLGIPFVRGKSEVLEKCRKLKDSEVAAMIRPALSIGDGDDKVISWLLKDIKGKKR